MSATPRIVDRGFRRIENELRRLEGQSIKVGLQSDAGNEPGGTPIVQVAAYNEYGTSRIPSRPFMRTMADTQRGTLYRVATRAYEGILRGGTADRTLGMVGEWYQNRQKKLLRDGPWTPNSPRTVAIKGSSTPLIDTARMVNAIRYIIVAGRPRS